ncbi:MAG: hypothetical protein LBE78_10890 [Burkholderiaceae bacterium]|jgi:hypothetical protein|nr:hypothetical protein [Burkholderiaceae bacterium]
MLNMEQTHQQLLALDKQKEKLYTQGRYEQALNICLQMSRLDPESPDPWGNAAVLCNY